MAQSDLADFFKAASADPALLERYKASGSPEAMVQVANQAGFAVTEADFDALASEVANEAQDLNDEALAGVSGGFFLSAVGKKFGFEALGQAADDMIGVAVKAFASKYSPAYDAANKAI